MPEPKGSVYRSDRLETGPVLAESIKQNRAAWCYLIVAGSRIGSKVEQVTFKADPLPVMAVTIVYYRP